LGWMIVTFAALHKRRKEHGRNSRAGSGVKAQTSGKPVRQALVAAGDPAERCADSE